MVDILHRVGVETATPEKVYDALTTVEGLAGWWTDDTTGSADVGGVLEFRFPVGGFDMEVVELRAVRARGVAGRRRPRGVDRHDDRLGPPPGRRLHDRAVQAPGLEGAGGVHAPLQHQVGLVPDEPEVAASRPARARPRRGTCRSATGTDRVGAAGPVASRRHVTAEQPPGRGRLLDGVVDVEGHPQPSRPLGRDDAVLGEQPGHLGVRPERPDAAPRRLDPRGLRRRRPPRRRRAPPGRRPRPTRGTPATSPCRPTPCQAGETSRRRASGASRSGSP